MKEFITINLGGYPVRISSYDRLLKYEQGIDGYEQLTDHAYNSMLFHNLGYDKCPTGLQWPEFNKPIEWIAKESTNVLDIPMTKHKMMLLGPTSLLDLMRIVCIWGAGEVETGNLLDYIHSFKLPSETEVKLLIENGYKVTRKAVVKRKQDSWLTSNVEVRRLYNINPNVDEVYFEHCFRNYTKYFRKAIILDPVPLFVASIIDPDFLLSIIRECEIQASMKVANEKYNGITALRTDAEMFDEFVKIFSNFEDGINLIYREEGAFGFTLDLRAASEFVASGNVQAAYKLHKAAMEDKNFYRMIDEAEVIANINISDVGDYLDNVLDDMDKQHIFKYLDKRSMSKFLADDKDKYDKVLLRIKRIIACLENLVPDMLDSKDKLILSKPFYMDTDKFGIYSKATNEVLIATEDNKIYILSPKNAIDLYKNLYNTKVLLDPKEIPPEQAKPVPRIEFIGKKNEEVPPVVSEPIPTQQTSLVNTNYQTPQYDNSIKVDEDGMIGINISNYIED